MSAVGILNAATPLVGGLFGLIDDLFTSEEERAAAKLRVMELQQSGALAQLQVNMKEAEHKSIFVAGWRPAVGWICATALGWNYILYPVFTSVVSYVAMVNGVTVDFSGIPVADMATMMPVLMGMLGLGAMRSWEKQNGVASNSM